MRPGTAEHDDASPKAKRLGRAIVLAAAVAMLAGCTTTGAVPASLLTCAPQPPSPAPESQQQVALYIVDMAEAGADCRSKLGAVRRLLTSGD